MRNSCYQDKIHNPDNVKSEIAFKSSSSQIYKSNLKDKKLNSSKDSE